MQIESIHSLGKREGLIFKKQAVQDVCIYIFYHIFNPKKELQTM